MPLSIRRFVGLLGAGVPRIHVHGLRHTFGSQMAMAGADPFAIMKALEHSGLQMTMNYLSLGKSHIREQVEKLDGNHLPIPSVGSCGKQMA